MRDPSDIVPLGKVDVPRAADLLAGRLRQLILAGELAVGQLLPPERSMVEQTGRGRASVREALRILEAEDLIESRLGRYGGWVVREPGRESVSRSIDQFIRGQKIRFDSLLDARDAIEPACARLAARHRTEADLQAIARAQERMRAAWPDVPTYLSENVHWHLAVVRATHNDLLIVFVSALADAIQAATNVENFHDENVRDVALGAHERIVAAIEAHDDEAAFRRMYRHVHGFRLQALGDVEAQSSPPGEGVHYADMSTRPHHPGN